jgi:hypothetical protein
MNNGSDISRRGCGSSLGAGHLAMLLGVSLMLAACQSWPVLNSQYISPRVKGRVLDTATRQPISNVSIRRVVPGQRTGPVNTQGAGDRSLEEPPPVRTDAAGAFDLDSERDLTLVRRSGWYSVSLAFTRRGYERFVTNFTLRDAVIASNGEPVVSAGIILLQPLSNHNTLK